VAENGLRVPFGELFRYQKTVVIFIRHFWWDLSVGLQCTRNSMRPTQVPAMPGLHVFYLQYRRSSGAQAVRDQSCDHQ
jgi:hypothetical protein